MKVPQTNNPTTHITSTQHIHPTVICKKWGGNDSAVTLVRISANVIPIWENVLNRISKGHRLSDTEKTSSSDAELVSRLRSGDQNAMGALYDRYSSIVYAVALRVLADTGTAEDVLQEVFMQIWRNPSRFDANRGSLAAWLAVIARNRAIDALRKRRYESDIEDVVVSVEPDLASEADRSRVAKNIRDVLNGMHPAQRQALEMAFFEGLTHTEIAAKIGEPLGTIKTRIRAGLLALRKALKP